MNDVDVAATSVAVGGGTVRPTVVGPLAALGLLFPGVEVSPKISTTACWNLGLSIIDATICCKWFAGSLDAVCADASLPSSCCSAIFAQCLRTAKKHMHEQALCSILLLRKFEWIILSQKFWVKYFESNICSQKSRVKNIFSQIFKINFLIQKFRFTNSESKSFESKI